MNTLKDYLEFRGDISFDIDPVNEIDEMIFSSMGKADYTGLVSEDEMTTFSLAFKKFFEEHGEKEDESLGLLESPILMKTLYDISVCHRFEDIKIGHFVNKISTEKTEQMSATTVIGPNGKVYVTFRGTDDTIVGWKENCELAILDSVPAQIDALKYLEKIASLYDGDIVVSGHSKGGNLAVYAAVNASKNVQDRIEKVISYDGPGFLSDFFNKSGYREIKHKITTMVPNASMVGMLMNHAGSLDVIKCEDEGPYAHDIFIWNLNRKGFIRTKELSEKSVVFHNAINKTLDKMDKEERQELVNEIFDVLTSTGAFKLLDFTENSVAQALKIATKLPKAKEIREFLLLLSEHSIKGAIQTNVKDLQLKIQKRRDDL